MARSDLPASCAGHLRRPLRPLTTRKRVEAFLAEVLHEALADGLVEQCPAKDGDGPGYRVTEAGREWLLDFPLVMLDCAPRARSTPTSRRPSGEPPTNKAV